MKKRIAILMVLCLLLAGCTAPKETEANPSFETATAPAEATSAPEPESTGTPAPEPSKGQIFLYGEQHSDPVFLNKELEIWGEFYAKGNRNLFIEMPYYTTGLLNVWMHEDSDRILEDIYWDWKGTLAFSRDYINFFKQIKQDYPETVFHGTDVGHRYDTIGARYLDMLKEAGMEDSEEYARAEEIIEQGKKFYSLHRYAYRENCMAENFIREFDRLADRDIMGIYGWQHTDIDAMDSSGEVDSMAKQLAARYGDRLHVKNLRYGDPIRTDRMVIAGKEYDCDYYGTVDLETYAPTLGVRYLEIWSVENAFEDLAPYPAVQDEDGDRFICIPDMPVELQPGTVYVVDVAMQDGSIDHGVYRCDGTLFEGNLIIIQIDIPEP